MCVILSRKGLDARKKPTYLSAYIALILLHSRVMHRLPQTSGPFFITSDNSDAYSPKLLVGLAAHARPSDTSFGAATSMRQGGERSSRNKNKLPQKVRTLYLIRSSKSVGSSESSKTSPSTSFPTTSKG